ncbi:UDP-galactopyranose mutase [Nonomuraea sp. NPDC046570]|uniref:UDP-galactopyranose mutase n=1 Tax=Nonomuraea sp. NPDC046570 TaxID=3155255 RepID=UPI0033E15674
MQTVRIIGGGLAGAVTARLLHEAGLAVQVFEAAPVWGGQLRTAEAAGVLYEPHGAHIFHTRDAEVWKLVNRFVTMRPYRHLVRTQVFGTTLSWPPQLGELAALPEWPVIERELAARPARPRPDNFETWCVDLMGETLYREFVEGYTRKQWGRDPRELAAVWAPKRIELRDDGYRHLFRDPFQGWPEGGYTRLVDELLRPAEVVMGQPVTVADWDSLTDGASAIVLTCALDEFFGEDLGRLPWRGVGQTLHYLPGVERLLPCAVVNHPSLDQPYTRAIETKWMSGQEGPGTVVAYERPGSPARHYPVDDVAGENRRLQRRYQNALAALPGPPRHTCGRLATYAYIDMDQAVRQAMNTAMRVLRR